jgi:SAM-dependent methyltransferase
MSDQHAAFVGSIPENYDRYLGPCLFEPYALDIVERVKVCEGASVLEIACGTGIVTRHLRNSLPKSARLVASDLNEAMLAYAAGKFGPDDNVGGSLVFNVWDAIDKNELALIAHETVSTFFEHDPPGFYQVPFGLHDQELISGLLEDAGFKDSQISVLAKTGTSPSAVDAARGLVEGNPVIVEINQRATSSVQEIEAAVAAAVALRCGDKPVRSKLQALVCTARR